MKARRTPFRVVAADCPWRFADKLQGTKGAAAQYPTMTVDELCSFGVPIHLPPIADDAYLFFWRVAAMQAEALAVINAWGFTVKSEIVWVKKTIRGNRHFGLGRHVRAEHEVCLIATRGKVAPKSRSIRSVFEAPAGRHSEKPAKFYELVQSIARGPYLELFARRQRPGWTCTGNESSTGPGTALARAA